jgi:hypothetical protein
MTITKRLSGTECQWVTRRAIPARLSRGETALRFGTDEIRFAFSTDHGGGKRRSIIAVVSRQKMHKEGDEHNPIRMPAVRSLPRAWFRIPVQVSAPILSQCDGTDVQSKLSI